MGHDAHYLSRLDRLGREQTELALALYRDHQRVAYILSYLGLPEGVDRIAFSLDDPETGPFIIVARNGHFVTCLASGMRLREGQFVVTREQLEAVSQRVDVLRSLLDEAAHIDKHETTRMFKRLMESGDRLTREQFEAISRWTPLFGDSLYTGMMQSLTDGVRIYDALRRLKRLEVAKEELLGTYWQIAWSVAHYALLLATDGGMSVTRIWTLEDFQKELGEPGVLLPGQSPFVFGVTSIAARGAWLDACLPDHTLGPLERAYAGAEDPDSTVAFGLGLQAVGLRHRRYEKRIRKAIARKTTSTDALTLAARERVQRCTRDVSAATADAEAALVRVGRDALAARERDRSARYDFSASPEDLPDDVVAAYALSLPIGLDREESGVEQLAQWMPFVATLEPAQFYVPESYLDRKPSRWEPEWALQMLRPRLRVDAWWQPKPVRAEARPGRNDPCSCGSGKKYKRCCGAPAGGQ